MVRSTTNGNRIKEGYFLTAFDDDAALLAAVPGNAALFLDQFLEVVLL
ncbi:MAG TPA: hypothetical protein VFS84_02015 [Candidatus Binatia bacterium]|nr:hypothetical protein [Candidatus Binatia bacterium]